jgi:6-phosphofructokinase
LCALSFFLPNARRVAAATNRFDEEKIIAFLERHRINQVYVIGGDGTHRGAYRLATAVAARKLNTTVCGVPKTIDNDVGLIDYRLGALQGAEQAAWFFWTSKWGSALSEGSLGAVLVGAVALGAL